MYHPHADEMVQMAMGMMGFVRRASARPEAARRVDRDFVFLLSAYDIDPGSYVPKVNDDDRLQSVGLEQPRLPRHRPARRCARATSVRVRIGNLTMTNHPIHMHGYDFAVTGTDGGWVPESARWPEVTIDVPVGADARLRVRRRRAGRLGDPLPQVAPHHERHGPRRADLHRRRTEARSSPGDHASSCPTTCRWARAAWPRWARWRCRCPTTRCR